MVASKGRETRRTEKAGYQGIKEGKEEEGGVETGFCGKNRTESCWLGSVVLRKRD